MASRKPEVSKMSDNVDESVNVTPDAATYHTQHIEGFVIKAGRYIYIYIYYGWA